MKMKSVPPLKRAYEGFMSAVFIGGGFYVCHGSLFLGIPILMAGIVVALITAFCNQEVDWRSSE